MPDQVNKPYWKEVLLIIFGATIAIIGGALTSWLAFELQNNASMLKAVERQSVLAGFQAEVEVNLIKLKNRFERYEKSIEQASSLHIVLNEFSTLVYKANLSRLGEIRDLGLISEIVSFYDGLTALNDWASSLRKGNSISENNKRRYVSQLANFLHTGIYLQARMANNEVSLPRVLPTPKFDDDKTQLLERIKKMRMALGANPPKHPLRFHPSLPQKQE